MFKFGLGGPNCFVANLSSLLRRLKGTSFSDTIELFRTLPMVTLDVTNAVATPAMLTLRMTKAR